MIDNCDNRTPEPDHIAVSLGPDNQLCLHHEGFTTKIPLNERGLTILRRILISQSEKPDSTIGEPGLPIQYMVDQWLKDNKPVRAVPVLDLDIDL